MRVLIPIIIPIMHRFSQTEDFKWLDTVENWDLDIILTIC